jgi:hypothetical protein
MRFRKLRIAWSLVWGLIAVLLIVLWMRSFWWADNFGYQGATAARSVVSQSGWMYAGELYLNQSRGWRIGSTPVTDPIDLRRQFAVAYFDERPRFVCIAFPHWLLSLTLTLIAVAPWLSWHYRIGTLLIITTFAAAMLGLITWASL